MAVNISDKAQKSNHALEYLREEDACKITSERSFMCTQRNPAITLPTVINQWQQQLIENNGDKHKILALPSTAKYKHQ